MSKGTSKQNSRVKQIGEDIWKTQTTKINSELFTLTYGSIVAQLCREQGYNYTKVNEILYEMGDNIGVRLIDELLSKANLERCTSFKETAEIITKIGFKMSLNIVPNITYWSADGRTFQMVLPENPLADFVELPDDGDDIENDCNQELSINEQLSNLNIENESGGEIKRRKGLARKDLWYSNILCGVLHGALEMVQLDCQVTFVSDVLRGDPSTEIRVKLLQILKDEIPDGDE